MSQGNQLLCIFYINQLHSIRDEGYVPKYI